MLNKPPTLAGLAFEQAAWRLVEQDSMQAVVVLVMVVLLFLLMVLICVVEMVGVSKLKNLRGTRVPSCGKVKKRNMWRVIK